MADSKPQKSVLATRLLSAAVLAPPVLAAIYYGPPCFELLVVVAAVLMAWEWNKVCSSAVNRPFWLGVGVLYIVVPCLSLVFLRADAENGRAVVFWLFILVWAADSGAYAFGILIGGPKLAPKISPKKTWAGFIGGISCAGAAGAATAMALGKGAVAPLALLSVFLGAVSQIGDLFESWVKRRFDVKDTSNIIPGHGGILDRVDGLMAAAVVALLLGLAGEGGVLTW